MITDCPPNLFADIIFYFQFDDEEVLNETARTLVEFFEQVVNIGAQDVQLSIYLFTKELNVTDSYSHFYTPNFVKRKKVKKYNIFIGDKFLEKEWFDLSFCET